MATLSESLAALRSASKSPVSPNIGLAEGIPFSCEKLVILYYHAKAEDVYIEEFFGLKLLRQYLGPELFYPYIPDLEKWERKAQYITTYEMDHISRILGTTPGVILWIVMNKLTSF